MQTSTPRSERRASPGSSVPTDRQSSSKVKHSVNYNFRKLTSFSSLQHQLQHRTPVKNESLAHDVPADPRPSLFKTPQSPSPVRSSFNLKTRSSTGKSTGSSSGVRMALGSASGFSTPFRSQFARDKFPKTPEPPSPVVQRSHSSLQWLRGCVEKNTASLSDLKAALAAVTSGTPHPSPVSSLGTCTDTTGSIKSNRSGMHGSRGIVPGSSSKKTRTPPLIRKCMLEPSFFAQRLQLSDDSDDCDEVDKEKPEIQTMKRNSRSPKRLAKSTTSTHRKRCPSNSVPSQSSVHQRSSDKGSFAGSHISGAHSSKPHDLQQQYSSKRGCLPSKVSHSAKTKGAASSSALPPPFKPTSMKNRNGKTSGPGLPVEDVASCGKHCHALLEEQNEALRNQLNAQKVLGVPQHSKRISLQSMVYEVNAPAGNCYIEINKSKYHVLSLIGRGGSSQVFMTFNDEKDLRAVKLVNMFDVPEKVTDMFMQEVAILKALRSCDRVVRLYDCEFDAEAKVLALVMEKGDQDLESILTNRKGDLGSVTIKFYWSEMLHAVKEIHDKRVVHSDLKPANFLFVAGKLKLIDFGIAHKIQEDVTSIFKESPMGTLNYMAPESVMYTKKHGKNYLKIGLKSDVWSLGCILYHLIYGRTPFHHIFEVPAKILALADRNQVIDFPDVSDPHLLDVLMKCLSREPANRPSITELLEHPYLTEEKTPFAGNQDKRPHVQSLLTEIENLSPASVKKVTETLKSLKKDKP